MSLERLHVDRCTVYRVAKSKGKRGGTFEDWQKVFENIPCRLSQKWLRSSTDGDIVGSSQEYKLFVGLNVDILQNDKLEVTRKADGAVYVFKASKPFAYSLLPHKEIVLSEFSDNEEKE